MRLLSLRQFMLVSPPSDIVGQSGIGPFAPVVGQPSPFSRAAAKIAASSVFVAALAGCQHRDVVDSTLDWYQQHQGGAIALQRPPPPGQAAPYPKVGLTPTSGPDLPSPALRQSLTQQLVQARNLNQRTVSQNGALTPVIPPPPGQSAAKASGAKTDTGAAQATGKATGAAPAKASPGVPDGSLGATLDAAEAPSPPQTSAAAPSASSSQVSASKPVTSPKAETASAKTSEEETEIAMPEFRELKASAQVGPVVLPEIPNAPPSPAEFPGFETPADSKLADIKRPDYDLSDPDGVLIRFQPGSDQLATGQEPALNKLVATRGGATLFVRGAGDTVSMAPEDQARAVELGLLRARTLADILVKRGVPGSAVRISGSAFGADAHVSKNG
ncbi:hypothetical protein J2D73_09070 [Acetobacter sacchari]|uniref:OmpA-like domain-containing protein n=1 Tax=Acetobacter sacchari TaxID=2661687 RepID=A0ABS3LVL4_9PROT|nr:hypothetical protein [Acetobacter sacchari]MBO1359946.1 hypothetical protein [Acetobacter sacchari]